MKVPLGSLSDADQKIAQELSALAEKEKSAAAAKEALAAHGLKTGQQTVKVPESLSSSKSVASEYLLYLPEAYGNKSQHWPLVLFLHGAGERGTNVAAVKTHGPPKFAEKKQFPFILVSPQCRPDSWWQADDLMKLIEHVQSMLEIDDSRIYVTGLSMGGYGTWELITGYPDTFAAALPICGGAQADKAERIATLPVWAFHGDQDTAVPVEKVQDMVDKLKELNPETFKFTLYKNCGHNSWTRTYNNDEVYQWLLSHSKGK